MHYLQHKTITPVCSKLRTLCFHFIHQLRSVWLATKLRKVLITSVSLLTTRIWNDFCCLPNGFHWRLSLEAQYFYGIFIRGHFAQIVFLDLVCVCLANYIIKFVVFLILMPGDRHIHVGCKFKSSLEELIFYSSKKLIATILGR